MNNRRLPLLLAPVFALAVLTMSNSVFGQGSKMKSEYEPVAEEDRDRPDLREEWMRNGRTAARGQSAAALRLRAHQQKMAMRARRAGRTGMAQPAAAQTGWVSLGPAPLASQSGTSSNYGLVTGRATSVAIDASDATGNTVYLGGAYGGVWKSTNAANAAVANVTWIPMTDQQASLATGAVSVKPDGSVVLVGTGEPNSAADSYYGVGILRSTDKGATWALIPSSDSGAHPFAGLGFSKFAWSTATPGTVVAATAGTAKGFEEGDLGSSTNLGLYLSTDSGQTWTYRALADGSLPISVTDVVYNSGAGKFLASVRYHGVYSSSDGTSWTRLANQPNPSALTTGACPTNPYSTNCPLYRGQLAAVPGRNEMYFWFVDINIIDRGIWRSVDGGSSWTQIPGNGITNCGDSAGCGVDQAYYNLEIAAVPNGSATDLYGGAVNLFKCTLNNTASTSCSRGDWNNLTHVYGCPNIANVHPDEHGMDFSIVNGAAIMYFANDGGIYRTLDGYTKLNSGSCGAPNGFDGLNGTMGSMTQFVSFSIHPTNQDIVLGGTQDNGSPATSTARTSTAWQNANAGDGGYNAINPANPAQWFTENYAVSIQSCSAGTGCNFNGFVNNLVVDSTTLNGDLGSFYTPFILDPQNPNELLVGTCRVWRGATAVSSAYSTLSNNFDGTAGTCAGYSGSETDLVRSLAAGGQKDINGFSGVVYATTEGVGPYSTRTPPGGEVWVTTNAGTLAMSNATGGINPSNYTISSVALDTRDTSGFTAYVGTMGFGGSHVWKTANAGVSWADWTGTGLPDAPVNALLVDTAAAQIYAGTDVGVFVSSTSSAAWTEVGPAAGPGVTGYLPNVPVSALRMFNAGGNKKLRVSTYGRGIWEYALITAPDFTNVISNSPQTVFPAQTATFNGTLTAFNGYNSAVNLSCTGTRPATCTLNPTPVTPAAGGVGYTVTASGAVGDYSFSAHGVGTDANTMTHDAAATLHVVDFAIGAVNPNPVSMAQGLTATATFQVTAAGSFGLPVTLGCSGLPANAACGFSPSSTVNPTAANPVTVTLTVNAATNTPQGTSTVTVQGATSTPAATRTTTFSLTVTAPPDFTWTTSGSTSHTVLAGQTTLAYNFTATPAGGATTFAADVTFACSFGPSDATLSNSSCTFTPPTIAKDQGTTPVTLSIKTTGPNTGSGSTVQHRADTRSPWLPLTLPVAGLLLAGFAGRKVSRRSSIAGLCVSLAMLGLMLACGGGGGSSGGGPSPPPSVTVTVIPISANLFANVAGNAWPAAATQMQFAAQVIGATNQTVTWAVTGGSANGTIDATGLYTAPATPPNPPTATITATSSAGPHGQALVSIQTPTALGTFNVTVTATQGTFARSQDVTLTVQ
ncbi:MAG TPA: hypothetical protein VF845_07495 [Terriglobales bacterium]